MKKIISIISAFAICVCLGASAYAATPTSNVPDLRVNGEHVTFIDTDPYIDSNNRTMTPVRFATEALGAEVSWDTSTDSAIIEKNGIKVIVTIGSRDMKVTKNGKTSTVEMDTEAALTNERTCVPIRFVVEALEGWIDFANVNDTVLIYSDVLTPEEIDRLHSYHDMSWEEYTTNKNMETDSMTDQEAFKKHHPEVKYFEGRYAFNNQNEWKLSNPNGIDCENRPWKTPVSYIGKRSGKTFTYGTQPNVDFAKLLLEEVRCVDEIFNSEGLININLRTDLSCVYASKHSNSAYTYIRGILDVEIPENANINEIENKYDFISNVKPGETCEIDVELKMDTVTSEVSTYEIVALQ